MVLLESARLDPEEALHRDQKKTSRSYAGSVSLPVRLVKYLVGRCDDGGRPSDWWTKLSVSRVGHQ